MQVRSAVKGRRHIDDKVEGRVCACGRFRIFATKFVSNLSVMRALLYIPKRSMDLQWTIGRESTAKLKGKLIQCNGMLAAHEVRFDDSRLTAVQ